MCICPDEMRKVCLLGLLSSALLLGQDYRRNTLTAGFLEAFRIGGNSYYIEARPGISLGYGVRRWDITGGSGLERQPGPISYTSTPTLAAAFLPSVRNSALHSETVRLCPSGKLAVLVTAVESTALGLLVLLDFRADWTLPGPRQEGFHFPL